MFLGAHGKHNALSKPGGKAGGNRPLLNTTLLCYAIKFTYILNLRPADSGIKRYDCPT